MPARRFTPGQVMEWRSRVRSGQTTATEIAREVDTSPSVVWRAVVGETYAEVPDPVPQGSWDLPKHGFPDSFDRASPPELVREWRRRYRDEPDLTFAQMEKQYGWHQGTIQKAVRGVTHATVTDPDPIPARTEEEVLAQVA